MDQKQEVHSEFDEINLMDYLNVILRRKRLIFFGFVLAVAGAGVFSYISPRIYRAETILEIGYIKEVVEAIEASSQIIEKLKLGVYERLIRARLGIPEEKNIEVKSKNPRGTNLLKIEAEATEPKLTKAILQEINNLILSNHQEQIKVKKELFENDIERLRTKIISLEEENESIRTQIEILEKVPLKEQTPASQFALFATKERLEIRKREIENLYLGINSHKRLLENIRSTKVIKAPLIPKVPIKPRPALNMSVAGILGIFFGTFLAFLQESLQKSKTKS